jgi:O-antigen/teichoic acid export membrane protein
MQIVFIPYALRGLMLSVNSVIYGIKEPTFILKTGIVMIVVSIGLNLWLIPKYGALGAAIATSLPRALALPVYIHFLSKKIGEPWPIQSTLKAGMAAIITGGVVFVIQYFTNDVLSLCLGIPTGIITYFFSLMLIGFFNNEDLAILRKVGNRLPKIFRDKYSTFVRFVSVFVK